MKRIKSSLCNCQTRKMSLKISFPILLLLLTFLSACEKETYYTYRMENQSGGMVYIEGFNLIYSTEIRDSLTTGEVKNLMIWKKRGKENTPLQPASVFGTDLIIQNEQGDRFTRNYEDLSNWIIEISSTGSTADHLYKLTVTEGDF